MLNTPMKVQWHKTTNFNCFNSVNMRAFFNFSVVQHIINKNTKLAIYAKLSQSSARSAIACTDQLSILTQNGNCYRRAPTVNCSFVCVCALWSGGRARSGRRVHFCIPQNGVRATTATKQEQRLRARGAKKEKEVNSGKGINNSK